MELILKYFPDITTKQTEHFKQLIRLYPEWNEKINIISRKDIQHLEERHILHSLSIAKFIQFKPDTHILDVGTGGGFPGVPLAVMFPQARFLLVDSVKKKINVVNSIIEALDLKNVTTRQIRVESINENFDFIISRAVTTMKKFYSWTWEKISYKEQNNLPNGIIYLKGGDLEKELTDFQINSEVIPISSWFEESFFSTKMIVYIKKRLILHSQ